ncbi:restriction endonuclease subunit S [Patescibacteria group bacterium]|nr:restriction endonuclease subunit S [Patescibacteria group bacterium]
MVPEDWEVKELRELLKKKGYIRGPFGSALRRPELKTEGIPVYEQQNAIYDHRIFRYYIDEEKYKQLSRFTVEENDLVISCSGTFGKVTIIKKNDLKGIISQALLILRPDSEKIKPQFLKYFFTSKMGYHSIASRSLGSVQINIAKREVIEKIKLAIPNIEEQISIVRILSDLDSKIELLQKQNKTLEKMGKVLFKRWFIDFEFPNEAGEPYKSSGGKMVESELGVIPKDWKIDKLGIYVDNISGCSYTSNDLQESQTALVTLKSIDRKGKFKQDGFKEYVGKYKESQVVKDGDIVVAHTDLTQNVEVLGSPALVSDLGKYKKMIASLDLSIVRPKKLLNLTYIYYLLKTNMFHSHAVGYSNGTTVIHLSKKAIPEFIFTVPEKNIIIKFEKIIGQTIQLFRNNEKMINILQKTRDLLLPKLMSGKIRVPLGVRA